MKLLQPDLVSKDRRNAVINNIVDAVETALNKLDRSSRQNGMAINAAMSLPKGASRSELEALHAATEQ
jgi:hypothetical protein